MNPLSFPSAVISAEWLARHIDHPELLILDASKPKVGEAAAPADTIIQAIKNARFFDLIKTFKDQENTLPNTVPDPDYFSQKARALGIKQNQAIVLYDRHGVYSSPRAWWLFRLMGQERVAILNGGLPAWESAALPTVELEKYKGPAGNFQANYKRKLFADTRQVLAAINDHDQLILDARSEGRFNATIPEPRKELRGGHIPHSINLPHGQVVKDGRLLEREKLQEIFRKKGAADKQLTFSCGSGITACILALAATEAGYTDTRVYDGSWTEWGGNPDLPVEKL